MRSTVKFKLSSNSYYTVDILYVRKLIEIIFVFFMLKKYLNYYQIKMNISVWPKWKILNEIFIFSEKDKVPNDIKVYFDEITMKKSQKMKVSSFMVTWKTSKYCIIAKLKDSKNMFDLVEDLVSAIWNEIKKIDKEFFLDLDSTHLNDEEKKLISQLFALNLYVFKKYKSDSETKYSLTLNSKSIDKKTFDSYVENLAIIRNLVNEPSNAMDPEIFEKFALWLFKWNKKVKIEVIKWKDLKKLGMNWIYEVGKGSKIEPRLMLFTYTPNKKDIEFGLIWKWVCFDAWGYNLKPTGAIEDMKSDMAWAALVLWTLNHLVNTWFDRNIVVWIPLVENLVSWDAFKPWDVIKFYNWKTSEIGNTDAEWRLILADALSYVEDKFNPKYLFNFATLTWAQLIALWSKIAAIVWKNSKLNQQIQKISWDIKERVWELPYYAPYFKNYKSDIADMKNAGGPRLAPWTILWGLFLAQFVKNENWVHFDIAWPAGTFAWVDELSWAGASWFGFRLLLKLLKEIK